MNKLNAWLDKDNCIIVNYNKETMKFIDKRFHCSPSAKIVWFKFSPDYGISTVQRFPDGEEVSVDYSIDDIINAILH